MLVVSAIVGTISAPGNLLLILLAAGLALTLTRWRRVGWWLMASSVLVLASIAVLPIGNWALGHLENRFQPPKPVPATVDGIIVLGGSLRGNVTVARDQTAINGRAERLTVFLELARRFPQARLVFTGGTSAIGGEGPLEADMARRFFAEQGLDLDRVTFESASRNTFENARLSFRQLSPRPGERWLLVTSASHMPRAMGCFRKVGWDVLAYPVDYNTVPEVGFYLNFSLAAGLGALGLAVHEWIGLIAYRALGRTDSLFPAPRAVAG